LNLEDRLNANGTCRRQFVFQARQLAPVILAFNAFNLQPRDGLPPAREAHGQIQRLLQTHWIGVAFQCYAQQ
jgi:hypothetical protein